MSQDLAQQGGKHRERPALGSKTVYTRHPVVWGRSSTPQFQEKPQKEATAEYDQNEYKKQTKFGVVDALLPIEIWMGHCASTVVTRESSVHHESWWMSIQTAVHGRPTHFCGSSATWGKKVSTLTRRQSDW